MHGRSSGAEGKRTEPYMQKTPADHAGGNMAEGSSVRRTKRSETGKNFVLNNYVIFLGK